MSVVFDSAGEYLKRTASVLDYTADYTLAAWVYFNAGIGATHLFAVADTDNTPEDRMLFAGGPPGYLRVGARNDSVEMGINDSAGTYGVGVWRYIALVRDGDTLKGYLRPEGGSTSLVVTCLGLTAGSRAASTIVVIGARGSGDQSLDGYVAYARAWTTKLTTGELDAEAVSPTAVKTASLWASWPLLLHTDLTDDSGNGRDLSANGTLSTGTNPTDVIVPSGNAGSQRGLERGIDRGLNRGLL